MDKRYIINVGDKGTFTPSGKENSTPEQVDELINNLAIQNVKKVALFFHGGLVEETNGIKAAKAMNYHILSTPVYPVSFVWETGFKETIMERIRTINKTKLFKKLLKFVIKKAGSKLGYSLDTKGFEELSDEDIAAELKMDVPFKNFLVNTATRSATLDTIENEQVFIQTLESELEQDVELDPEFKEIIQEVDTEHDLVNEKDFEKRDEDDTKGFFSLASIIKFIAVIAFKVIKRHLQKRNHGFYPTVIEEILRELYIADFGAWVWDGMKKKAKEMWCPNLGLSGTKQHAGTYFLEKLNQYALNKDFTVDLIGHSAGSIAICYLLKSIDSNYPNLNVQKVIFMAPACRSDLFHSEIVSKTHRFKSFRMFTMTDEVESNDALVDKIPDLYPCSLLYFISGVLEDEGKSCDEPILGMERYFNWDHYYLNDTKLKEVRDFLMGSERIVLSPTSQNPIGFNCMAIDHSDFDEDQETITSILHLLKLN